MIKSMLVSEWMSPAETVSPETPFRRALARMQHKGIRSLVVVQEDRLVGIITMGDIRHAMPSDVVTRSIWDVNQTWDRVTVAHLMNHTVITIEPHRDMIRAAGLMLDHGISRLPVVSRQGKVLGVLTSYDIHRMLIAQRTLTDTAQEEAVAV